ncbi:hypothetical protein GTA08_BOTSDO09441 [Botryosphaeria dothidea]|uniref:Uncharacterized protein n=1 Tax=Botryosphaeria dothidea TaxID=55169 RepID=A0A8H4ILL9_9PEZI|nr:hypothetical protein GTA08_BOTSDO09441 [Botryosphaeria dothidea]
MASSQPNATTNNNLTHYLGIAYDNAGNTTIISSSSPTTTTPIDPALPTPPDIPTTSPHLRAWAYSPPILHTLLALPSNTRHPLRYALLSRARQHLYSPPPTPTPFPPGARGAMRLPRAYAPGASGWDGRWVAKAGLDGVVREKWVRTVRRARARSRLGEVWTVDEGVGGGGGV